MITTITLTTRTHGGWIARIDDSGDECFVPDSQVDRHPECEEFTAVIVPNKRQYPEWFCHRLRPAHSIMPVDVHMAMDDLPIIGYTHAAEMGYAAGLCDKIVALRGKKTVDAENLTWYVDDIDNYSVEEIN